MRGGSTENMEGNFLLNSDAVRPRLLPKVPHEAKSSSPYGIYKDGRLGTHFLQNLVGNTNPFRIGDMSIFN